MFDEARIDTNHRYEMPSFTNARRSRVSERVLPVVFPKVGRSMQYAV